MFQTPDFGDDVIRDFALPQNIVRDFDRADFRRLGLVSTDLDVVRDGDDAILTLTDGVVRIENQFSLRANHQIERFQFVDGDRDFVWLGAQAGVDVDPDLYASGDEGESFLGGRGDDFYSFVESAGGSSDGEDVIRDLGGVDTVTIDPRSAGEDEIGLRREGEDLLFFFDNDALRVEGQFAENGENVIETFILNGVERSAASIQAQLAASDDDRVARVGTDASDNFVSTAGGEFFEGRAGNDTYQYRSATFGDDVIREESGNDRVDFRRAGLTSEDIAIDGEDAILSFDEGQIRIEGQFGDDNGAMVERFQFADGLRDAAWLETQAMDALLAQADETIVA